MAPGAYNWELEDDAVLALKPQPDTRAEAAQATAITALQMAEAATAKAASAREEADKAWAEARTARERAEAAEERAEAAGKLSSSDTLSHRKPARKFTDNWPMLVATEMIRLARHDPETLENINGLIEHMRNFLNDEIGWRGPNDDKEIRTQIRLLLGTKR